MLAFAPCAYASPIVHASEVAPGDYRWDPSIKPIGRINMHIDLNSQQAFVYRDGVLIGIASIASGKPGYRTPTGTYTVLEKERFHRSNKYDNAPMPFMQRLSWGGLALHGGHPHGYPASHGCIRMPMGFAEALFQEATQGMTVTISGYPPSRRVTAIASRDGARAMGSQEPEDERAAAMSSEDAAPTAADCANDRDADSEASGNADDLNRQQIRHVECNRSEDEPAPAPSVSSDYAPQDAAPPEPPPQYVPPQESPPEVVPPQYAPPQESSPEVVPPQDDVPPPDEPQQEPPPPG